MTLQVLGRPTSINVRKVLWLCAEMTLAYENLESDAEVRALNPNAMVPVIRDGELTLWESNAICRYLAAAHGRTDLLPANPAARAKVEQWMDWQATELNNSWRYAVQALIRKSPSHTDAASIAASIASWNRHMGMLDEQLEKTGAYAAGSAFTLADIVLGLATNRWYKAPMERPALPAVEAYFERLTARPAFVLHAGSA